MLVNVVSRSGDQRAVHTCLVGKHFGNRARLRFDTAGCAVQNNRIESLFERRRPETNITIRRHHE